VTVIDPNHGFILWKSATGSPQIGGSLPLREEMTLGNVWDTWELEASDAHQRQDLASRCAG